MPRRFFKRVSPPPQALRKLWYLRFLGARLADPRLWSVQRRVVTAGFGAGLAICFVPAPIHLPLAVLVGIAFRLNIPALLLTVFLVNPLTFVPIYYFAYSVGAVLLGEPAQPLGLSPTVESFRQGFASAWQPLLLGCLTCAVVAGLSGWAALETLWRLSVWSKYRARSARSRLGSAVFAKNAAGDLQRTVHAAREARIVRDDHEARR
jgi:uncharacterized protein